MSELSECPSEASALCVWDEICVRSEFRHFAFVRFVFGQVVQYV